MFITRKHLSRRTLLKGVGATVALPLLDAMIPAQTACAHAPRGNLIELNTSIDQVIAQKIGQGTTFPSMELAIEDSSNIFGTCAADFLCTYMDTISWRTPTQPLPMELNPRVVFERMFGGDGTTAE